MINMRNNAINEMKKTNENFYFSLLVFATLAYTPVTLAINSIVNLYFPGTPIDTALCLAVYLVIIFKALPNISLKIKVIDVVFVLGNILLFMLALINNETYTYAIDNMPTFFIQLLPMYFLGRSICDAKQIEEFLYKVTPIVVLLLLINSLFALFAYKITEEQDKMGLAYHMLPFSLMALFGMLNKFSLLRCITFFIAFVLQVFAGTRGPILCIIIALIMHVIFHDTKWKSKIISILTFILLGVYFLSDLFIKHIELLSNWLEKAKIENRILNQFLDEDILNSSGRDFLNIKTVEAINASPIFGHGFLGDRVILGGTYVHNIFYEFLCHFGILFGVILFSIVVFLCLNALFKSKKTTAWILMLILTGFVKLFMSGSYVFEPMFFLLIGYCVNLLLSPPKNIEHLESLK